MFSVHSRILSSAHLNEVGNICMWNFSYVFSICQDSRKRQSCDIGLSWVIVQGGVDRRLLWMLCLWLVQGWSVLQSRSTYSFASRKRVSWGYSFTSSNDLFGSSWVTCQDKNKKIWLGRLFGTVYLHRADFHWGEFWVPPVSANWSWESEFPRWDKR